VESYGLVGGLEVGLIARWVYPRAMAGKPAEPPAAGQAQSSAEDNVEPGAGERAGPLAVERLRKADGRALILYSSAGREA